MSITKGLIVVALLALIVGVVAAFVVIEYYYPNIGSITTYSLELYLDNVQHANNTVIDWGECEPGWMYSVENMTVVNTGTVGMKVYIEIYGLPSDWTLAWQQNETSLAAGAKTMGWLNLTIPSTATSWPTWSLYLRGETT